MERLWPACFGCWLSADARSFPWSSSLPWTLTLFWAGDSGDQQNGIHEGQIRPHILQRLSPDFTFKTPAEDMVAGPLTASRNDKTPEYFAAEGE